MSSALNIGIIGGTGALGSGLAYQWARQGYGVLIGSRSEEKGKKIAAELRVRISGSDIEGCGNREAVERADVIVMTVPYSHHRATLDDIGSRADGKIFVDSTVPLVPPRVARVQLSDDWPVAATTQRVLGDDVRVVSAFHNVAAAHLQNDDLSNEGDVLVFGNNNDARQTIIELIEAIGLRGWHAGSIANSVVGEALTSVLIFMNKKYGIDGAGVRITGDSD